MSALPILYSFRRCPYAMRARLALRESGQRWEHREVLLRSKPADLLAASPKATVPVLLLPSGARIDESEQIMLWALSRNDLHGWLSPESGTLAAMRALIARSESQFKPHLDRYKYPGRFGDDDPAHHRQLASVFVMTLEKLLASPSSGFLFGAKFSLADAAIAPFVRQFANTDRAWFDAQPWPQISRWLSEFVVSARFLAIMDKVMPWAPGDELLVRGGESCP